VNTPLRWSSKALGDLARLHAFLAEVNPEAAAKAVQTLTRQVRVAADNYLERSATTILSG
jgi:plasmid stabilization system protein ParE